MSGTPRGSMRIAWLTPLPPMGSGIADYSAELLPLLAQRARVDAVCPRGRWPRRVRTPAHVRRIDPDAFDRRTDRYDAVFHHLGNNPDHAFVYRAALERPAIAVFHDFVMHHLIAHLYVESAVRDLPRYERLMRDAYGDTGERLADLRWRKVATDYDKFLFPLNEQIAKAARAIVVHNQDSAERMRWIAPDAPVTVIPHHAGSPPPSVAGVDRAEARRRLGLPASGFLVGHFGYVTKPKQPAAVIGGFEILARERPDALLVLTGADRTGGGLDRTIHRHGLDGRVRKAGYVDMERFYLYLRAVDAVINLRYPSAGESSGTFARALAEGLPTIVNDLGSFAEVPSEAVLKVDVDGDQAAEVGAYLIRLASDRDFGASVGSNARTYATAVLAQERCRDLYLDVARRAADAGRETDAA